MQVQNMTGRSGQAVANQFIVDNASIVIKTEENHAGHVTGRMFQSYNSNIAFITYNGAIYLDERFWDYSRTTGKYRNQFLGETKAETQKKIDSGEYILTNLNA